MGGIGAVGAGVIGGDVLFRGRTQGEGKDSPGALADTSIEQPLVPYRGSHRVIWSVDTTEPWAALTFDDGPDPEFTPRILEILADHDVRATFMMMGYNVAQHADLARELVAAGHEVGNHTWTHLNLLREPDHSQHEEILRGHETIEEVTGVVCSLFRPPRGQLTGPSLRQAALLGCDTVLWSVDRGAPGISTPDAVADFVETHFGAGDIIDLHDGLGRGTFHPDADFAETSRQRREVEIDALPRILADAAERGLRVGRVADVLAVERVADPGVPESEGS